MAAPIQRYSDPRLYGSTLVRPYNASYQWIKTVAHPLHPKANLIAEVAIRSFKLTTGVIAISVIAVPALVGRSIQIIHYHCISQEVRLNPPQIAIDGMQLPRLETCHMTKPKKYHGTDDAAAIAILRWGFDASRTASGSKMGEAVYVSEGKQVSFEYGGGQLVVSLDLRDSEIAHLSRDPLCTFLPGKEKDVRDKKVMASVRKLYYQNGYRAIRYNLDTRYGREEAWAVYDPSCITIKKIKQSRVPIACGS
jgi:hypothetical protein